MILEEYDCWCQWDVMLAWVKVDVALPEERMGNIAAFDMVGMVERYIFQYISYV